MWIDNIFCISNVILSVPDSIGNTHHIYELQPSQHRCSGRFQDFRQATEEVTGKLSYWDTRSLVGAMAPKAKSGAA
jgi:hypothetical protein